MSKSIGFPPVAETDARFLILGTLPGAESLRQRRYYAYRQNAFWRIMGHLTGAYPELDYNKRLDCLRRHRIALWDVCHAARREGSLDSAIIAPEANDFAAFFAAHGQIKHIGFNGQNAQKLFRQLVLPDLQPMSWEFFLLPSTSPAHAGMGFEQKLKIWREALRVNQEER